MVTAHQKFDVIVIGSGAAGLSAALTAARGKASVIVLEKTPNVGGTTCMSGAGLWIPNNHVAKRDGYQDSTAEVVEYLYNTGPDGWDQSVGKHWVRFAEEAPRVLKLLEEETPLRFEVVDEPDPFADMPGGKAGGRLVSPKALSRKTAGRWRKFMRRSTWPHLYTYFELRKLDPEHRPFLFGTRTLPQVIYRWFTDSRGQGSALVAGLINGCLRHSVEIEVSAQVEELLTDNEGSVVGVKVRRGDEVVEIAASRGVVLATGGFEWNLELRERYFPGPRGSASPRTNTGDGHLLALNVGAELAHMDQANFYGLLPTSYESRPHYMPNPIYSSSNVIVVNRNGERIDSEWSLNIGETMDKRDPETGESLNWPCFMIGDAQFLRKSPVFKWYARKQKGWMVKLDSLERLAEGTGLPRTGLVETVKRYNAFAKSGRDEDFHRGENTWERYKSGATADDLTPALGTITKKPFFAIEMNRPIVVTKGGPKVNEDGQVLRPNGSAIGGLYCCGVGMANPFGTRNMGAGTTLGPCLTWGYICGQSLLSANRE